MIVIILATLSTYSELTMEEIEVQSNLVPKDSTLADPFKLDVAMRARIGDPVGIELAKLYEVVIVGLPGEDDFFNYQDLLTP
jgi:hypothetical protein